MSFTLTPESILTVAGATVLISLLTQIFKSFLGDKKWTTLLAIGIGLAIMLFATLAAAGWDWRAGQWLQSLLTFLYAVAVAVLGYETVSNTLGILGLGDRSAEAVEKKAVATLLMKYPDSVNLRVLPAGLTPDLEKWKGPPFSPELKSVKRK